VDDEEPQALRPQRTAIPSDLTDGEWAYVEPLIPPAKSGGNKRRIDVREVMNGIMYVLSTGCQWRAIPKDLPARSTLFDYLDLWSWTARWTHPSRALCGMPVHGGREPVRPLPLSTAKA